ncbi:hypothetical protein GCM10010215_48300 [Streptomyces virginiae]|uniref:Uncharacterized protein n=1 Tax=Streptomyces virginiae TaxID=1961 RepID=A0ABQ3NXM1_STRVG|nr:hypothetical protein GCM10010215_48300 [Streptomyces virginiae]GHI17462.1 hypothetical protein Scinn_69250 [Streptomyces virginiae]
MALRGIGAVLSTVAAEAGDALTREVLLQLPPGYDILFGHPQPWRHCEQAGGRVRGAVNRLERPWSPSGPT